jgi:hypothetical protein
MTMDLTTGLLTLMWVVLAGIACAWLFQKPR